MRVLLVAALVLLATLWAGSLWAWPEPGGPGAVEWLLQPVLALLVTPAIAWDAASDARLRFANFPGKDELRALPPERRESVMRWVRGLLYSAALHLNVVLCVVQYGIHRTAQGHDTTTFWVFALVGLSIGSLVVLVPWVPRIQDEIERQQGVRPPIG